MTGQRSGGRGERFATAAPGRPAGARRSRRAPVGHGTRSSIVLLALAVGPVADSLATTQQFATISGGSTTDKLRFDPAGSANQDGEIGRFWQSTNSTVGHNFAGGCPSGGAWWQSNQPPLRGIQGWIGTSECQTAGTPFGHLTLVVEDRSAAGDRAFFIALRASETPGSVRWWDFSRVDPSPSPSVLGMVELPRPIVVGAWGGGSQVTLSFLFPDVAAGVHAVSGPGDTPLPASAVVASYDLYRAETPFDPGRDASLWTLVHQEPYADGPGSAVLTVPCSPQHLFALGLSYVGGSGPDVPGSLVSRTLVIECGLSYPPLHGIGVIDLGRTDCTGGEQLLLHDLCGGGTTDLYSSDIDLAAHVCEVVELEGLDLLPGGCSVMQVETLVPSETPCLVQVRGLALDATAGSLSLAWEPLPCTDSYDLIRGTLPVTENLGPVTCLADDVPAAAAEDATGDEPAPRRGLLLPGPVQRRDRLDALRLHQRRRAAPAVLGRLPLIPRAEVSNWTTTRSSRALISAARPWFDRAVVNRERRSA